MALSLAQPERTDPARNTRVEDHMHALKPARVLVVDDETPVRAMIAAALEREGYAVELAGGGREALQVL